MPGYRHLKHSTLRKKCKEIGLSTLGSRSDLIDRLEEHDAASNSYVSYEFLPAGKSSPKTTSSSYYLSSSSVVCPTTSSLYCLTAPSSVSTMSHTVSSSSKAGIQDPLCLSLPSKFLEKSQTYGTSVHHSPICATSSYSAEKIASPAHVAPDSVLPISSNLIRSYEETPHIEHEMRGLSQHQTVSQHVTEQHTANIHFARTHSHTTPLPTQTNITTRVVDQSHFSNSQAAVMPNVSQHYAISNVDEHSCYGTAHRTAYHTAGEYAYGIDNSEQHRIYRPRMVSFANDSLAEESYNNNIRQQNNANIPEYRQRNRNVNNATNRMVPYGNNCQSESGNIIANIPSDSGHFGNARDICSLLPDFHPTIPTSLNAMQFVNRVEMLRNAYGWSDDLLIFAVQQKMQGPAKNWVDSLNVVFRTWPEFVTVFTNDFPCMENETDVHVQMARSRRNVNELPSEYYYRMLACGRRGGLSDAAVTRHIINGINEPDLKRRISKNYSNCTELLRDISAYCSHNEIRQQIYTTAKPKPIADTTTKSHNTEKREDKQVKCFNCHKMGHYSRNCPEPQRKERCGICHRTNHKSDSCPEKSKPNNRPNVHNIGEPNSTANVIIKQVMVNHINTDAFVDPGSHHTLLRKTFAEKLGKSERCSVTLSGFGGGQYSCVGKIVVQIKMDDVEHVSEALVVADHLLSENVLLGRNVLCQEGIRLVIEGEACRMENVMNITAVDHLNNEQQKQLETVLQNHQHSFANNTCELGKCNVSKMEIELTSSVPICIKPYRVPFAKREIVEEIITDLLKAEIIRPSVSPYASGVVLVEKRNGEHRLCVDYRPLNSITVRTPFPMPNLEEQFAILAGNKYFTTLDLKMGYHQIEMEESSKKYTAFMTTQGHYEYNRMPFGLVNAPAVFQRIMNSLTGKMISGEAMAYLDDIIIPSKSVEEGLVRLDKFLTILEKNGLTLRLQKCKFLQLELAYLGHKVSENGRVPGDEKVRAIKNFQQPTNVTEVRRFLGLTGFFRKFVEGYAVLAEPLTNLLRKDNIFNWGESQKTAFVKLIDIITSRPVLSLYDFHAQHEVHTDASSIGIAGVLLQSHEGKTWHPVYYYSRHCSTVESNYHSYELEMMAVVESLECFRVYVLGKSFRLITDCSAIAKARVQKELKPKIARWWMNIMDYDCEMVHRQGSRMSHIDALSRAPDRSFEPMTDADRIMILNLEKDDWLLTMQIQDSSLLNIIAVLKNQQQSPQAKQIKAEYCLSHGRLYRKEGDKLCFVVPKSVRWRIVKWYHDEMGHFGVEKTIQRIGQYFWFAKMRKYVKDYISACVECCYNKSKNGKPEAQLYVSNLEPIPFRQVHLDHLCPFIRSKRGNLHVLAISDAFSKFLIVKPVKSTKTQPVISALNEITSYFGLPRVIVTDRGTAYTSKLFEDFCDQNNIQHVKTAVRTPRANGQVERANRTILSFLRTSSKTPEDWDLMLRDLQWSVNSQRNETSGFSPNELVFDFKLIDVVQNRIVAAIHEDISDAGRELSSAEKRSLASEKMAKEKERWKVAFDRKHRQPTKYDEGNLVVVENEAQATGVSRKLEPKFKGPYTITRVLGRDRYLIEDIPGMQVTGRKFCSVFSAEKLKPWCGSSPELDYDDRDDDNDDDRTEDDPVSGKAEL